MYLYVCQGKDISFTGMSLTFFYSLETENVISILFVLQTSGDEYVLEVCTGKKFIPATTTVQKLKLHTRPVPVKSAKKNSMPTTYP
jgi:hypothetical protein